MMNERTYPKSRPFRMWFLVLVTPIALFALAGSSGAAGPSGSVLAGDSVQIPKQERTAMDKLTGVAAIVSIGVVGIAGVYIYRLIRKGL